MNQTNEKDNLKRTWKYYLLTFAGLGLLWLGRQFDPPISTALSAVGAVCFFAGVFLVLLWDRRRKRAEKELEAENNQ